MASYTATLADHVGTSDTVGRTVSSARSIAEGDAPTGAPGPIRFSLSLRYPETISGPVGQDVVGRIYKGARGISETLLTSDITTATFRAIKVINEHLTTNEVLTRILSAPRTNISETLTTSDMVTRLPSFMRPISESLSTHESLLRIYTAHRSIGEPDNLTGDVVTRIIQSHRTNVETLSHGDILTRRYGGFRAYSEALVLSEQTTRVLHTQRGSIETLLLSDIITRGLSQHRSLGETLITPFDVPFSSGGHHITLGETLTTSDAITQVIYLSFIMGYIWVNPVTGGVLSSLPDWGWVLTEDPLQGNFMNWAPIPAASLAPTREK